jgi:hypothetical protein
MSPEANVNDKFIPFHAPSIGEDEIREVADTLRSGWLTTGPRTARFEREFGEYVQSPHSLALNSATAALHLALDALKIQPGDEGTGRYRTRWQHRSRLYRTPHHTAHARDYSGASGGSAVRHEGHLEPGPAAWDRRD